MKQPAAVDVTRLSVGQRLQELDVVLDAGEALVVLGPNGAGKSTLLRALAGLTAPTSGAVHLHGRDASTMSPRERAAEAAWLPQRVQLGEDVDVRELVATARYRFGENSREADSHARKALHAVGAEHLADRRTDRISGGELQRVLLATLIAQDAPLLLVDEPANHLDPRYQMQAYELLGRLWQSGKSLVLVTHDINLTRRLGPATKIHVLGLTGGREAFRCRLDDARLSDELTRLYGVRFEHVPAGGQDWIVPTSAHEGDQ